MDNQEQRIQAIGNIFYHPSDATLEGYTEENGIIRAHFETTTRTIIDHEHFSFPAEWLQSEMTDQEISKKCESFWY